MTSLVLALALLTQCPNGQCSLPTTAYYPQFAIPQAPTPAPQPTLYELADITGQRWRHRDPAYLQVWVTRRNGLILRTPAGGR